jgi:hypothetical protein
MHTIVSLFSCSRRNCQEETILTMNINHIDASSSPILEKLVFHLPYFIVDPLIVTADFSQFGFSQGNVVSLHDTVGTGSYLIRVEKDSSLQRCDLGRDIKRFLYVCSGKQVSAVCCRMTMMSCDIPPRVAFRGDSLGSIMAVSWLCFRSV